MERSDIPVFIGIGNKTNTLREIYPKSGWPHIDLIHPIDHIPFLLTFCLFRFFNSIQAFLHLCSSFFDKILV